MNPTTTPTTESTPVVNDPWMAPPEEPHADQMTGESMCQCDDTTSRICDHCGNAITPPEMSVGRYHFPACPGDPNYDPISARALFGVPTRPAAHESIEGEPR